MFKTIIKSVFLKNLLSPKFKCRSSTGNCRPAQQQRSPLIRTSQLTNSSEISNLIKFANNLPLILYFGFVFLREYYFLFSPH